MPRKRDYHLKIPDTARCAACGTAPASRVFSLRSRRRDTGSDWDATLYGLYFCEVCSTTKGMEILVVCVPNRTGKTVIRAECNLVVTTRDTADQAEPDRLF